MAGREEALALSCWRNSHPSNLTPAAENPTSLECPPATDLFPFHFNDPGEYDLKRRNFPQMASKEKYALRGFFLRLDPD
jgi:hypothetical protein